MAYPREKFSFEKSVRFFVALYFFAKESIQLFALEYRLAKKSAMVVILSSIALLFFLLSFWLITTFIYILLLHLLFHDWLVALILAAATYLLLAGIALWIMTEYAENLNFSSTRKMLFSSKEK